jgi:hypothetical protein
LSLKLAPMRVAPTGVVVSQSARHFSAVSGHALATQFHFSPDRDSV